MQPFIRHTDRSKRTAPRIAAATLVELAVVLAGAAVLSLCVGVVLGVGTRLPVQARKETGLRQDAYVALRYIQTAVRKKASDEVSINVDGDTLTLDPASGSPPYFTEDEGDLLYFNGTDTITVIDNYVAALSFELVAGNSPDTYLVSVALQLTRNGSSVAVSSLTELRNAPGGA